MFKRCLPGQAATAVLGAPSIIANLRLARMAHDPPSGSRARIVLTSVITAVWMLTAARYALTGDVQGFAVATGPFGLMCGAIFGIGFVRRVNGRNGDL